MEGSRGQRVYLLVHDQSSWPTWLPLASAIGPALVAVATVVGSDVERPLVLAAILAVAVSPWLIQVARRCSLPPAGSYVAGVALAVQHLAAEPLRIVDPGGAQQTSLIILSYAIGEAAAVHGPRHGAAMTVIGVVTAVGSGILDDGYDAADIWTVAMFIGLFCGLLIRKLLLALVELKDAQDALEVTAATRERQRIAREVHDVIAHSMTVAMLHITAARMAVARGDTAAATEALEEAERQGRRSLADIRTTVGLLRAPGVDGATDTALPAAGDLDGLVADYRAAGVRVDASTDHRVADLPAPTALAVHRIVQESLANVAKHAPGASASVNVRVGDDIEVVVADDGPGSVVNGSGHGLLGMRERAESLGGTFEAGPTPSGWRVRATLPLGLAAPT